MAKSYTIALALLLLPNALLASPQSAQEAEARKAADATFKNGILAKIPSKANDRARCLDDFRKRLPAHPQLPKL